MDHHSSGFASPWAAVLGHHAMTSGAAEHAGFAAAAAAHVHGAAAVHHPHPHHHHHHHHGMPMDLHVPQGFPYYRYNNYYTHIRLSFSRFEFSVGFHNGGKAEYFILIGCLCFV